MPTGRAALPFFAILTAMLLSAPPLPAAEPVEVGIVNRPCPPTLPLPADLLRYRTALLDPRKTQLPGDVLQSAESLAYRATMAERNRQDWANLCFYRDENAQRVADARTPAAVFMGDSITENWMTAHPAFFGAHRYVSRGIGGQTTQQMLLRFRDDVVALRPRIVHILAGTNDIAGNTGPTTLQNIQANIESMVELATAHHIGVVLGSVLPALQFPWRPEIRPGPEIAQLNRWLGDYARRRRIPYVDYFSAMADDRAGLKAQLTHDGVHPHLAGYAIMEQLAETAISEASSGSDRKAPPR
jgi:acyl-CoA thioesterase-1